MRRNRHSYVFANVIVILIKLKLKLKPQRKIMIVFMMNVMCGGVTRSTMNNGATVLSTNLGGFRWDNIFCILTVFSIFQFSFRNCFTSSFTCGDRCDSFLEMANVRAENILTLHILVLLLFVSSAFSATPCRSEQPQFQYL